MPKYIFDFDLGQEDLSSRHKLDLAEIIKQPILKDGNFYQVFCSEAKETNKHVFHLVKVEPNKLHCDCDTFVKSRLICSHIFYVAGTYQNKGLTHILLHPCWGLRVEQKEVLKI